MSGYTPGPWEACQPGDYGDFDGESRVVCSADPDDMRRIAVVHWSERHPETDANATLISLAPEMLEALEKAESVFRHYGDLHAAKPDEVKAKRNYDLADELRALIARARGAEA